MERCEAADVDVPQVDRRLAADDPLRDELSRAAGVRYAGRVESGADEIASELGRFAENEVAIGREAFGAVEQQLYFCRFEAGRAVHGVLHQDLEVVPVLGQELELEDIGKRIHIPRLGLGLEAAHHETADFLLVVEKAVGVADHGQVRCHPGDRLGHQVEMLAE
jgi:hypothetical protein